MEIHSYAWRCSGKPLSPDLIESHNKLITLTISSSSIAIDTDSCRVISLNSPDHIALRRIHKQGCHNTIDTTKLPVNRKKTKFLSSATTLYCITRIDYPLHDPLWLFYQEVLLPPFWKLKFATCELSYSCTNLMAWYIS